MTATETPIERLERLRAQAAALDAPQAAYVRLPAPGTVAHCTRSGTTIGTGQGWFAGGAVLARGQNFVISAEMLEANRSARGVYLGPGLLHDPEAQIARYGAVVFVEGEAPADMVAERGTSEWREGRESARQSAWREPDPQRRTAALKAVQDKFGDAPVTSVVLTSSPDPSIRQAEEQRARLDAGGIRLVSHYSAVELGAPLDEQGNRR